jgi:hypothetical protein
MTVKTGAIFTKASRNRSISPETAVFDVLETIERQ